MSILGKTAVSTLTAPTQLTYIAYDQESQQLVGCGSGLFVCGNEVLVRFTHEVDDDGFVTVGETHYRLHDSFIAQSKRVFIVDGELLLLSDKPDVIRLARVMASIGKGGRSCDGLMMLAGQQHPRTGFSKKGSHGNSGIQMPGPRIKQEKLERAVVEIDYEYNKLQQCGIGTVTQMGKNVESHATGGAYDTYEHRDGMTVGDAEEHVLYLGDDGVSVETIVRNIMSRSGEDISVGLVNSLKAACPEAFEDK